MIWPIDYKSRRVQISALEEEHERIRECHPPSIDRLRINQPTDRIRTRGRRWGRGMGSKATALLRIALLLSSREAREARRRTRAPPPPLSSPLLSSHPRHWRAPPPMASSVSRAAGAAATMAKAARRAVAQGFSPPFLDQASQISSPPPPRSLLGVEDPRVPWGGARGHLCAGLLPYSSLWLRIFSQHQSDRMGQQGCGQVLQRLPCFLHSICHWRHKGISYHHQQLLRICTG